MKSSDTATDSLTAADMARTAGTEVRQGVEHAVEAAKLKLTEVKGRAMHQVDIARTGAHDATESLRDVVVRHPLASIGIAAGVGLLIGAIFIRPRF